MYHLFASLDECIVVLDGGRWGYYVQAGGVVFGVFLNTLYDPFDLSNPAGYGGHAALINYDGSGSVIGNVMVMPPSIKVVVINQSWRGLVFQFVPRFTSTIVVGKDQAGMYRKDSTNLFFMDFARTAETLEETMPEARKNG